MLLEHESALMRLLCTQVLSGHEGPVAGLAFSPAGPLLASASWDHTLRTWDVFAGKGEPECCAIPVQRRVQWLAKARTPGSTTLYQQSMLHRPGPVLPPRRHFSSVTQTFRARALGCVWEPLGLDLCVFGRSQAASRCCHMRTTCWRWPSDRTASSWPAPPSTASCTCGTPSRASCRHAADFTFD